MPKLRCWPLLKRDRRRDFGIGGDNAQQAVQIAILEHHALAHEREIILENALRTRDGLGLTLNFESIFPQPCADIQTGFEQPDIFIPRAKKPFNAAANLNCGFHLFGVRPPDMRMGSANIRLCEEGRTNSCKTGNNAAAKTRGRKIPSDPIVAGKYWTS